MKKDWYKEKVGGEIQEGYKIVGKNDGKILESFFE